MAQIVWLLEETVIAIHLLLLNGTNLEASQNEKFLIFLQLAQGLYIPVMVSSDSGANVSRGPVIVSSVPEHGEQLVHRLTLNKRLCTV